MVATDEIDKQIERFHKAEGADDHSQDRSIHNSARGAQIVQTNQISTPQMVAIIVAILISCLALALWYNTGTTMQLYEREIRLAQRDAQDA